ncbi:DUF5658 family protein [Ruminococcus sp.]|uniref:DUF5658 family protein n=1 Tax=Ruminococcus sp. TaxID=41978 RepID=UPI00386AD9F8
MSEAINIALNKEEKQKRVKFTFYQKIFFLYFLNITDWICTEALLASGQFAEANPVMQPVLNDFWQTVLIKGIIPLAVIIVCCLVNKWAGSVDSKLINIMLYVGISIYMLVNLWHIFNFVLLFFVF